MRTHAAAILGMDITGHVVHRLWVEHASDIAREYYASFTLDRGAKLHLCMVSAKGGVEIEEVAATDPDGHRQDCTWTPSTVSLDAAARLVAEAGLDEEARPPAAELLVALYRCYVEGDCDLAEINPLILTTDGRVHALDAKVTLDDNAAFRHPEWEEFAGTDTTDEREKLAKEKGLNYIGLDGSVGIIANGAGLAMSTLDVVNQVGGSAANFLDIGGGANADVMAAALEVINTDPAVRSIFVNIFGGITRCDEVANGIVEALGRVDLRSPIVLRLDGTNAEAGREILASHLSDAWSWTRRCSTPPAGPWRWREETSEHLRRREHQGRRAGPDRQPGPVPRPAQPRLRHPGRGRRHPGQGRHRRGRRPRLRHRGRGGAGHRGRRLVRRRAAQGRSRRHHRGGRGRHRASSCASPRASRPRTRRCSTTCCGGSYPRVRLLGPNCPGIISPGKCNIGITSGDIALPGGPVGIVSRSGTLTYQALHELSQQKVGQTTCVGIGGDPVPGTNFIDCLAAFEDDPETRAVMMIGEIGGSAEEEAAQFIADNMTKPVVCYIAGVTAPPGRKMGHAGAIISGSQGTAQAKMDALAAAGATVALNPTEAGERMVEIVKSFD